MKRKFFVILSSVILLASVSTSVSAKPIFTPETDIVTPFVNTGWSTKNGIEARVYTDRTKDYPVSDDYVGITGEKRTTGSAYYQLTIDRRLNNGVYERANSKTGTFASSTGQWKVNIDDLQGENSHGTYRVMLKVFAYGDWDTWLGDWTSDDFVVYN
ncbi:hypothetical protein ACQKFM_29260 [Paenibacillus xylanexedens]|uniref:hypothetical protein n=1 Tax=Paenibacillus xylanexedens TaxID=528191 RepID=UPI003D023326